MAVVGHQQIGAAVVVEIGGDGAETEAIATQAGLLGDVGELAVAVVAEQVVVGHHGGRFAQRIGMHFPLQRTAAHHEEVRFAVVVIVEPDASGAGAFE